MDNPENLATQGAQDEIPPPPKKRQKKQQKKPHTEQKRNKICLGQLEVKTNRTSFYAEIVPDIY